MESKTTITSLEESVHNLNSMVQNGQVLEAFEKYYAPNIQLQENHESPLEGKDACRQHEEAFVNGITEFRKAEVKKVIISDNLAVVEWDFDFTHKDWGTRTYTQLAVQRWNDEGQIINETFYYNN